MKIYYNTKKEGTAASCKKSKEIKIGKKCRFMILFEP